MFDTDKGGHAATKENAPATNKATGARNRQGDSTTRPRITKTAQVLAHLKRFGSITSIEAFHRYGATRLSGIVHTLRRRGVNIQTDVEKVVDSNGNACPYGRYRLIDGGGHTSNTD